VHIPVWALFLIMYLSFNIGAMIASFGNDRYLARLSFKIWTTWLVLLVYIAGFLPLCAGCWLWLTIAPKWPTRTPS